MAHRARVVSLVVSDVPGDNPAQVASGPTVPDTRTREEARAAVVAWRIDLPKAVAKVIAGETNLPPIAGTSAFESHEVHIVASAARSLEAAATLARAEGIPAVILSDAIEGEARDIAKMHAAITREVATRDRPFARPVVILSGGETTVTLAGSRGRGGRNSEFLLSFASEGGH